MTRITGTLPKDLHTIMITRAILRTMINVSDKSCRENQNTYFTLNNASPPPPQPPENRTV